MKSLKALIGVYLGLSWYPSVGGAASCQQDPSYQYARELRNQQYYVEAKPVLQTVIARDPACMAARLDLALTLFSLGEYDQAEAMLGEVRLAAASIPDPVESATVLETINSHLARIPQLREEEQAQFRSSPHLVQQQEQSPAVQVAVALGVGDNVNGGLHFDKLTFDIGNSTFTKILGAESKAQAGTFMDLEAAYQRELPPSSGLDGTFRLMAAARDNHLGEEYDLGTLRGGLELKPGNMAADLQPSIVFSGGSFFLGGDHYRQDIAVGAQILPEIFARNVKLSYQLTDSDYKTVEDTDSRFHKINLSVPLTVGKPESRFGVGLDLGYQWPESSERLADYREVSARLRLVLEPAAGYAVSASYGLSQQHDVSAYNPLAFGDSKRNLEQQVLDIGWSHPISKHTTYEANLLARKTESAVKLFENSSVEVLGGVRWELD